MKKHGTANFDFSLIHRQEKLTRYGPLLFFIWLIAKMCGFNRFVDVVPLAAMVTHLPKLTKYFLSFCIAYIFPTIKATRNRTSNSHLSL